MVLTGCMRVSTGEQSLDRRRDVLACACCERRLQPRAVRTASAKTACPVLNGVA